MNTTMVTPGKGSTTRKRPGNGSWLTFVPPAPLFPQAGPANSALQITPMKNLVIVRGTERGHRQLSQLLGALAMVIRLRPS